MDPILFRATLEPDSASAGVIPGVKDLHSSSSSTSVSIVSRDWIRGNIRFAFWVSELPSTLWVFQRILAL